MIAVESTKTVLRLATLNDRAVVIAAFQAYLLAVDRFGHDVMPTQDNATMYWNDVFAPAIREQRSYLLLAQQDDAVIGALFWFISGAATEFRKAFAWDFGAWVATGHRRNNLATEMRVWAMQLLRERGVESVISTILKDNIAGLASYEKVGGKITGYMVEIPIVKGEV